jgi:hypothetical protein
MRKTLGTAVIAAVALTGIGIANGGAANASTVRPSMEAPQADPVVVVCPRHSTVFARGVWLDMGRGKVYVNAPLRELVPGIGWVPAYAAEVDVQKLTAGHWATVARLKTNAYGVARGLVKVGGGVDYLRVVHPRDRWTTSATGTTRRVVVTTEPLDIV